MDVGNVPDDEDNRVCLSISESDGYAVRETIKCTDQATRFPSRFHGNQLALHSLLLNEEDSAHAINESCLEAHFG